MISFKEALLPAEGGIVSLVGAGGKTSLMFSLARELSMSGAPVLTTTTTKINFPTKHQSRHIILSSSSEDIIVKAKALLKTYRHVSAANRRIESTGKLEGYQPRIIDDLWQTKLFRWILVEADGAAKKPLKSPGPHEPVIPGGTHIVIGVIGLDAVGKPLGSKWVFRHELYAQVTGLEVGASVTAESVASALLHERGIMKTSPSGAARIVFLNKADHPQRLKSGRRIANILIDRKNSGLKRIVIGRILNEPSVLEIFDYGGELHG